MRENIFEIHATERRIFNWYYKQIFLKGKPSVTVDMVAIACGRENQILIRRKVYSYKNWVSWPWVGGFGGRDKGKMLPMLVSVR